MRFAAGTQVWVRCEDGEWWPAKVSAPHADMASFLGADEDCLAEFYHNPGQLYPIISTDTQTVQRFHARVEERSAQEAEWIQCPVVQAAVNRALKDSHAIARAAPAEHPPAPHEEAHGPPPPQGTPFSSDELSNIRQLLGAVSGSTASQLLEQLAHEGVHISPNVIAARRRKEQAQRKRPRASTVIGTTDDPRRATPLARPTSDDNAASAAVQRGRPMDSRDVSPEPRPVNNTPSGSSPDRASETTASTRASEEGDGFVAPAEEEVLEVIRAEVFDNASKFVLSPKYRFLDLLGAVNVENQSLYTALPAPQAVREVPAGGFEKCRRVLLVPLSSDYSHTMGWMRPLAMDDTVLSMEMEVNGVAVPVPTNWNVAAAKEANAVKTAPVSDITDAALATQGDELIKLHVRFLNAQPDMVLWMGVIACIFVEEVELTQLAEQIVRNYTPARHSASPPATDGASSAVATTRGTVSIVCPISARVMTVPVRSTTCQHLQCMDLMSVLSACARANIWNCPLCGEPIPPNKILVNYRLRDWLSSHRHVLSKVKAVVETPQGQPLVVQYRVESHAETIDVDD